MISFTRDHIVDMARDAGFATQYDGVCKDGVTTWSKNVWGGDIEAAKLYTFALLVAERIFQQAEN